ncbi:hypothetical protein BsWGS_03256 [Bradybaena similaris]
MASEDGCWHWMVVVAAFFTQFIVCGITYSLGVFHVIFKDMFNATHFDTSWIGSILLYVTALSSVMFRFITSYFGPRVSVILGGLLATAGLGMCFFAQRLLHLYLSLGLLTGLGFGLACTPSIVAIERYFIHQRFQALSIVVAGIGAGIVTFPMLIRVLVDRFAWRGAMLVLSAIALNLCVCGIIMKPTPHDKEMRLMPMLSCFPLRHPIFIGMCLANFFWSFGSTVIYMYLPSYAMKEGTSFETSVFLVSCIGICSFASRIIFAFLGPNGTLDDVTSALCPIMLGVVVTGIAPLLFEDYSGQISYAVLFGYYSGFWTTFLSQVCRELLGPEYIAMGNGYLSFMIAFGSLAAGPLTGLLLQHENDDFKFVFYLAGSCLLCSSVIMVLFKIKRCRTKLEAARHSDDRMDSLKESRVREQHIPLILEDTACKNRRLSVSGHDVVVDNVITCV